MRSIRNNKIRNVIILNRINKANIWRSPTDPIILSTIPHFLSLVYATGCEMDHLTNLYNIYITVIVSSSTLSVMWHIQSERRNIIFWLDYGFAIAWTTMDLTVALSTQPIHILITVSFLNFIVFITNHMGDFLDRKGLVPYQIGHTYWHIISSSKSVIVAYLLQCSYE
jgi:hypothetical protein